jgi:CRISPR-associated endonuclease/helicase Cas3
MDAKQNAAAKTDVNNIRQTILADCRKAAVCEKGIFSLTVPTGGGKTLSSLAFALEHAAKHRLDRVIYVIPFTSIIEQNANVFRDALGSEQVIEHHSNLDIADSTPKARLAAENWDAPVIVTTSIQFFESLFAAKPSRCRKLHNISNSVVILDEAQLVPVEYLTPILQTMDLLTKHYNVTFVISTATQPAFESRDGFKGLLAGSVKEIISDVDKIYAKLDRVTVLCPTDLSTISEWNKIAIEIERQRQVLCIVSDRKSCRELFKLLPSGAYHLSALMCGQHRSDMIAEIKNKLSNNEKVQVVSTQLVEAGVDFDFPIVYRAIAGLDSIAQAAGRCNREGKLQKENAVVKVFIPPKKSPPGILRKATETTKNMIRNGLDKPLAHQNFEKFFSELYWKAVSLDVNNITAMLKSCELTFQFRTASDKFRIIDDSMQKTIVVPYRDGKEYINLIKSRGPERWILRKLQRYSVNVYTQDFVFLQANQALVEIAPELFALESSVHYDDCFGLSVNDEPIDPDRLIL